MCGATFHLFVIVLCTLCFYFTSAKSPLKHENWEYNKISLSDYPNARCLDGSPAVFYFQKGEVDNFAVYHQGGGWCTDVADCYTRSKTHLGSSKHMQSQFYIPRGLFADEQEVNPIVYNWNKVVVGYCDGGSYTGTVKEEIEVPNRHKAYVHLKGSFILDAIYAVLLNDFGMKKAKEVIISGSSAGGLGVYLHIDRIAEKIKSRSHVSLQVSSS